MAKIMIDSEGAHLPGSGLNGFETLCGNVDTHTDYECTIGTPTCHGCISAAKELLAAATPSEIKSWKL